MALIYILLQATSVGSSYSGLIMIVLIFIIMYFFMIRPQQKQRKRVEEQRASLKEGDKVVISGGIHGKLKKVNDTSCIIEIAEMVKVEVDKLSVFACNDVASVKPANQMAHTK
ncbi:MAG: preprotein translocase subunit YajC [Candidatus Azobacteroides pseudotrichonymphae]|jgi:preprotein translocase subunit YajC|uniref:Sec translocon accessory complex subunit YajC n=1 Tax=Azobacteroides pseudotrichonymphae genomovar. CFP2 TaxID=511995 RepID=B6YQF5_AZOPC|nr:preprotein translocase subunit YajC [Candidatus Azobacteroides pseudotrichonymphae]MDR0530342.1 preprotein translocase subunit YajC [Bacteroidales bacterium OttesenSCG-928-I14]BAG83427.1 preprotein translocase YajC subunit [Candidatus Azobacteroides pseudotrichonymphae genomovar. CFP2]GMO36006.1 MAG: preprotein translocase subunit YajC [Candidatus Azobacteroides pseudotrichonymphae]